MSIDAPAKRRKPFTPKTALAFLLVLIGSAATIALPIVLISANRTLNEQGTRVESQDKEIRRLKSENLNAISRADDLQQKYQSVVASKSPDAGKPKALSDRNEVPNVEVVSSNDFDRKLAQLEERALGAQGRNQPVNSDDFESRLTRLYEKVVLSGD